ncbi:MAG: hypothetical protein KBD06_05125 [Candidatus Pacebacteria bacterium]|nr:hypothetical protein [Candidatus Paceibacterota bacterium]
MTSLEMGRNTPRRPAPEGMLAGKALEQHAAPESADDALFLAAHKRALKILNDPQHRVSPDKYIKTYGKEVVEKDMQQAREQRARYETDRTPEQKETYMLAEIFEAMMLTEGQESGWLGDDVKLQKTTDYDDMFNHTDMIAEWHSNRADAHSLGLAVDVTFGARSLEKKFERLHDDINKGRLSKIKYAPKEQTGVPRVIIGMSRETVYDLMNLWMEEEYDSLAKHPIQAAVLEQILTQLQAISQYAESKQSHHVAAVYRKSIQTVRTLLNRKSSIPRGEMRSDTVSDGIKSQLAKHFSVK